SEFQGRMPLPVKRGGEPEGERVFDKWDLHAVRIGSVTSDGVLRVKNRGSIVAEIPNRALTDEAPLYRRPMAVPEYLAEVQRFDAAALEGSSALRADRDNAALLALLSSPTIGSK